MNSDSDDNKMPNRISIPRRRLLILGLLWIVVNYVAGNEIPGMAALDNWNLLIGMGFIVAGFLVFTRWK